MSRALGLVLSIAGGAVEAQAGSGVYAVSDRIEQRNTITVTLPTVRSSAGHTRRGAIPPFARTSYCALSAAPDRRRDRYLGTTRPAWRLVRVHLHGLIWVGGKRREYSARMRIFHCQACGQRLDFENTSCEQCGRVLGFLPEPGLLTSLDPIDGRHWRALALGPSATPLRFCANANHDACNWLVRDRTAGGFCPACKLNRTIPNLSVPENLQRWQRLEVSKHRLVYGLLRLGLTLPSRSEDPQGGLAFDFLGEDTPWLQPGEVILTGYANGVIVMGLAEADAEVRERQRRELGEAYRTLLGHFRHEVGHYYWERLILHGPRQEQFRECFGDERGDYESALTAHRAGGPPLDWRGQFVSAYASAHPLEDWAETWAHYLHLVDTTETAHALGIRIGPEPGFQGDSASIEDPYTADFETMVLGWMPLTYAANGLSRSMGLQDLYPFVLSDRVIGKLRFVHDLIREIPQPPR